MGLPRNLCCDKIRSLHTKWEPIQHFWGLLGCSDLGCLRTILCEQWWQSDTSFHPHTLPFHNPKAWSTAIAASIASPALGPLLLLSLPLYGLQVVTDATTGCYMPFHGPWLSLTHHFHSSLSSCEEWGNTTPATEGELSSKASSCPDIHPQASVMKVYPQYCSPPN